jgi:signal transduction histidine kinase
LGVGVAGMRERLQQLGGVLDIESGPGGTIVRARIPIDGAEA